jgi:predicted enzyme related to lactoylglutathione lyase
MAEPELRTGKLCYVEIPSTDPHESAEFYAQAFGWRIRGDMDRPSFDDTTGQVSGAFVRDRRPAVEPGLLLWIMVADAVAAADAVVAAGGEIVLPVGNYDGETLARFRDPGGNVLGIYQQPGLAEIEAQRASQ